MNQSESKFTHIILKATLSCLLISSIYLTYKLVDTNSKSVIDKKLNHVNSFQVQSKLSELKIKFEQNSAVYLLVEFATLTSQANWLWIEVLEWNEKSVTGLLIDRPTKTFHLRHGSQVKIKESSIKDYQLYTNNIFVSGNLTYKKLR